MKNLFLFFKSLLRSDLPFDTNEEEAQIYTPREFVSGFIPLPRHAKPLEAAWHAAAVALETERIRIIHRVSDNGIYFIAAAAATFASHPNAKTPLSAVLPDANGYKGDGAYLIEMGSGIVAVIIKEQSKLQSYIGERVNALRFAGTHQQYWPTECESWVGYTQFESRHARRLSSISILLGMIVTGIFISVSVAISVTSGFVAHRKDIALDSIRAEQLATATQLGSQPSDAYTEYRKLTEPVVSMGGKLIHFESTGDTTHFKAEFPQWVTNLGSLGSGIQTHSEGDHIVATK